MHRAVSSCSIWTGCVLASVLFVGFLACSTHIEQPAEEPEQPTPTREGPSDGFNQDELGQIDELLDAGVSTADAAPEGEDERPTPADGK